MPATPRSTPTSMAQEWPSLPETWAATRPTLHMWTQIVGKVRLALSPWQNHYWHSTLYVSARGLTTSAIPNANGIFQLEFDFLEHRLQLDSSWGYRASVVLEPRSVANFYAEVMSVLRAAGISVSIWSHPVEIADPIPFEQDEVHAAYDPAAARAFWSILIQSDRVFKGFRGRFLGKSSPVHFFWGSFDLAVTRFSGRRAPLWSGPVLNVHPHVMHASYSHELSSAGFWPGDGKAPSIFYSYAVPAPAGFAQAVVIPTGAAYSQEMGEFVMPYSAVQSAAEPDTALREFLQSTYDAAASLGGWDRPLLEESPACLCDLEGRRHPA
ncbi:MAG: hypothetical protein JO352_39165 [Chloroflexi bacterium]|nr:hypothetical protein [Chloroflexota bacterium]